MKKLIEKHINLILWILITATHLSKFVLSGKGLLTEPDEKRYYMTWSFLKHLSQGDLQGSIQAIFYLKSGRPIGFVLHSIPASLQFLSAKLFQLELFESKNAWPVFLYNFLIITLILYVLYRIFILIFQSETIALTGVFLTGIMVNYFVYLRHIYPYNEALLLLLLLTYRIIKYYQYKEKIYFKQSFRCGFLAFTAILIYPAYYLYFIALFILFALSRFEVEKQKVRWIRQLISYGAGSLFALFLIEILSHIAGMSYIENVLQLSGTVIQGSFQENFVFLFKYLWEVEKLNGLLTALGIALFILLIIREKNISKNIFVLLFVSFFIPFLWHASMGYFFHKYTFYGRIIHQFYPVIIIMNLYVLSKINPQKTNYIIFIISILMTVQYIFQINSYQKIAYPRDVYWTYLKKYPKKNITEISEYKNSWTNLPLRLDSIYVEPKLKDKIIIVNGQYFYPVDQASKYQKYTVKTGQIIFDKPHFINYKAYQYEGYGIEERRLIDRLQFRIKVIKPE